MAAAERKQDLGEGARGLHRTEDAVWAPAWTAAREEREHARNAAASILTQARGEASRILAQARETGASLVEAAQNRVTEGIRTQESVLENLQTSAFNEGYDTGLKDGEAEGIRAFENALSRLQDIRDHLARQRPTVLEENRDAIRELVQKAGDRIAEVEASTQRAILVVGLARILTEVADSDTSPSSVTIRLHPEDLAEVQDCLSREMDLESLIGWPRIRFEPDKGTDRGTGRFELPDRSMEVSYRSRFATARNLNPASGPRPPA